MTTVAELAARALRRIRVVESGESPAAADQADAEQALTDIHGGWIASGLTIPALPLDARFDAGVVAILAVRLSEDYGKGVGPVLLRDASRGERDIMAAFLSVPASRFDDGLISTGHDYGAGILLGQSDDNYSEWAASTAYDLREYVTNGGNLYECTVAGTSAGSGGPTGTNTAITDGTVTWTWRRVVG
jgi:hypothetical protein